MPEFQPAHLAQITQGKWHAGPPRGIKGFCFDTRKIEPGHCFVALKSEARDGHDFVADAMLKGASSAITARPLGCGLPELVVEDPLSAMGAIAAELRSQFARPVIGITGSCGKTSTKEMLRLLLGESHTHATAGNWNNRIGVPMTLFDLDPVRHAYAVIEAGINQPGEMQLLGAMIRADLTILTNIGPAHLELLGTLEGIAREKSKLAETSKPGAPLILPAEALEYPAFAEMAKRCIAVRFDTGGGSDKCFHSCRELATARSIDEPGRFRIDGTIVPSLRSKLTEKPVGVKEVVTCRIEPLPGGTASKVEIGGRSYTVHSSSQGIARNAALAIVAARSLGVAAEDLAERIQKWKPERTRGRVVSTGGRYYYIDCYNANPASMIDALQAFQNSAPADLPRCYILGAMNELGASAGALHASVAEQLKLRRQDLAVFVGPVDLTTAYLRGAEAGGASAGQLKCAENMDRIESMVADFQGALFLKGSRAYRLEKLLPESVSID